MHLLSLSIIPTGGAKHHVNIMLLLQTLQISFNRTAKPEVISTHVSTYICITGQSLFQVAIHVSKCYLWYVTPQYMHRLSYMH